MIPSFFSILLSMSSGSPLNYLNGVMQFHILFSIILDKAKHCSADGAHSFFKHISYNALIILPALYVT